MPRALFELLALVAPPTCCTCRGPLRPADEAMCDACRRALPWLRAACCPRCALPVPCSPCPAAGAAFEAAWAPMAHRGMARDAVAALKFSGATAVADVMAAQMAANVPRDIVRGAALVPVPLPPARRRSRGFNQAALLARALGRRLGLSVVDCCVRRGRATRQVGATRRARRAPGRLEVVSRAAGPERAVLVDDVHTTGATLHACALALRAAGSRRIACVTYARALQGAVPAAK